MRLLLYVASLAALTFSANIWPWHSQTTSLPPHQPPPGLLYALLVAGSDAWINYRHQADVAHSYHTLIGRGVPAENIILMMNDDIVYDDQNPFPGKLFNEPHGPNVYEGLKIDYKGDDLTPENFLAVLKGDDKGVHGGNGRVLNTTENDRIFVFFSGRGATGILFFPEKVLTVKQLNNARSGCTRRSALASSSSTWRLVRAAPCSIRS